MDDTYAKFHLGRRDMINAFVKVSNLARRVGVNEDDITAAHGQFFDGNAETKSAFHVLALLVEIRKPWTPAE